MFVAKWIEIKNQLPKLNEKVLICTKSGKVTISTYLGDKWKTHDKTVERWMPLPSSPEYIYRHSFEDDFFGAVINCAVRYACGRQSYMPSLVVGEVRKMIPFLNDKTIGCMERDICEADKFGGYGDEKIDKPMWLKFLAELQKVMEERGIEKWQ